MDPVVLVQVLEQQNRDAAAMVAVCTAALRRGTCQLASPTHDGPGAPRAVAVVSWKDRQQQTVLVEVGKEIDGEKRWLSRRIDFQPQDAVGERWRVVGLTVATLVGDLEDAQTRETLLEDGPAVSPPLDAPASSAERATPPARQTPPKVPPATTPARQAPPNAPRTATISPKSVTAGARPSSGKEPFWAVVGGGSLDPMTPRVGGWLRAIAFPQRHWFLTISPSYSVRPKDANGLQMSWAGVSTGGGLRVGVPGTPLHSRYRLELVVERVLAAAEDSETKEHDERARLITAGRGGIELEWPLGRRVGVIGAVDAVLYAQPVRVRFDGSQRAVFSQVALSLNAGMELKF